MDGGNKRREGWTETEQRMGEKETVNYRLISCSKKRERGLLVSLPYNELFVLSTLYLALCTKKTFSVFVDVALSQS